MSDRKYIGLFMIAFGLTGLLYPILDSEFGPRISTAIEMKLGIPHVAAALLYVVVMVVLLVAGVRTLRVRHLE